LTEAHKAARVQKCRELFACHAGDGIISSHEKLFLLQKTQTKDFQQNDRVYNVLLGDILREKFAVELHQSVSKTIVWGAISK
jgi:hypothetical protein